MPMPRTRIKNKVQAKQYLDGVKTLRDKILDSKISQKVAIPLGNAVIKGVTAPLKWAGKQIEKDMKGGEQKWKDLEEKNRIEKSGEYTGPFKIRTGRGTSDGRMSR